MSYGLTAYEFVQQVYYVQEKVILDWHPSDDKFAEVIMEANLVLQELQKEEDWTWLRERLVLGHMSQYAGAGRIPEFQLPIWVYKPSTLYRDGVRLHRHRHGHIVEDDFIDCPWTSSASVNYRYPRSTINSNGRPIAQDDQLKAVYIGQIVTFNRPLLPPEENRIAVTDVQRRIEQFPMPTIDTADDDPDFVEKKYLVAVPDPNYVVVKTAERHAQGSPVAQGRIADLGDQAQKLLSAMRQNDASATDSDYMEWDAFGHLWTV